VLWCAATLVLAVVVGIAVTTSSESVTSGRALALPAPTTPQSQTTPQPPTTIHSEPEATSPTATSPESESESESESATSPESESESDPTEDFGALDPAMVTGPTDSCGNPITYPEYSAATSYEIPRIRVLLGSAVTADLDTGHVVVPDIELRDHEIVAQTVRWGTATYLYIVDCNYDYAQARVLTVDDAGTSTDVRVPLGNGEQLQGLLASDDELFGIIGTTTTQIALQPLEGGPLVGLPTDFYPYGAGGGYVIGTVNGSANSNELIAVGLQDRKVKDLGRINLGSAFVIAIGPESVVWAQSASDPTGSNGGRLASFTYATEKSRTYSAAIPDGLFSTQVSPDGRYLAGRILDLQLGTGGPRPPAETGVFDLKTGKWIPIEGLHDTSEFGDAVGTAFSQDGRSLVVCVSTADGLRLLLWNLATGELAQAPLLVGEAGGDPQNLSVLPDS